MSENEERPPISFPLTPRQRRHRMITVFLLSVIGIMLFVGVRHPFFDLRIHAPLTPVVRKALAAKGIMIMGYWTVCFLLAMGLIVVAWLEYREIQRKLLTVRRDIWREIAGRHGKPGEPNKQ